MPEAYKFPDEVEDKEVDLDKESKLEVEIEDDTPPEDRGRTPMPKPLVEELEQDELEQYDENVKIKLKQMRKVWHDERREKEAALREQQEAVAFAQQILQENRYMKGLINSGEKEYATTIQHSANLQLEAAKRAYKEAYEAGDADRIVEAQQALQDANLRLMQAKNFKLTPLQDTEVPVQTVQAPPTNIPPRPDDKALEWQDRNPWFGQDEEMTAAALGLHEKLKRNGVVVGSPRYYEELDKTIRKRFPENFDAGERDKEERPSVKRNSTVVAPATRSTASNKVRLTSSAVQLARKLGLTPEQYAQEVLKLKG